MGADDVLRRYFHASVKPVMLVMLYFAILLWFCNWLWSYAPDPDILFIDPHMPPEARAELKELFKDFPSFLNNMILWNFGRQFDPAASPIFPELLWRTRNTLLFILLATLSSLAASGLIVALAAKFKPKRWRPLTYTHSSLGFLFGLTPLIALILIHVFCNTLRLTPRAGLISMPPPSSSVELTLDMLRHLIMPTLTITLVNVARTMGMIRSGVLPSREKTLKSLIFSFSSIDFRIIIPTVVITEVLFGLPGLGQWLIDALMENNYPAVMACFIALLAITVGLGCISAFIDAIKAKFDMNIEGIEEFPSQNSKVEREKAKSKGLKRYLTNKRMIIGLIIVLSFVVVAVGAPLLTPYLPESQRQRPPRLATRFAYAEWLRIFPEYRDYNPTIKIQPDLHDAVLEDYRGNVAVDMDRLLFNFTPTKTGERAWVLLDFGNFSYEYGAPPTFTMHFAFHMKFSNVKVSKLCFIIQNYTANPLYEQYFRDPTKANMTVYIQPFSPLFKEIDVDTDRDSFSDNPVRFPVVSSLYKPDAPWVDPAQVIFSQKGIYGLKIMVEFECVRIPPTDGAYAQFTLKEVGLTIWGRCHGILGTNSAGHDVWTELVYGARSVLLTSLALAAIAVVLGLPIGFLAGYFKEWTDKIIIAASETLTFIPIFIILLINMNYLYYTNLAILVVFWVLVPIVAVASRNAYMIKYNQEETIKSKIYISIRYALANLCFTAISVLLLFQTVDFLGFGDPNVPTWGRIFYDVYWHGGLRAWWVWLPPVMLTLLLVFGFFLIGTSLDDD